MMTMMMINMMLLPNLRMMLMMIMIISVKLNLAVPMKHSAATGIPHFPALRQWNNPVEKYDNLQHTCDNTNHRVMPAYMWKSRLMADQQPPSLPDKDGTRGLSWKRRAHQMNHQRVANSKQNNAPIDFAPTIKYAESIEEGDITALDERYAADLVRAYEGGAPSRQIRHLIISLPGSGSQSARNVALEYASVNGYFPLVFALLDLGMRPSPLVQKRLLERAIVYEDPLIVKELNRRFHH